MDYDVLVVGGGVAGLSTAISVKKEAEKKGKEISVALIEKGSAIGSHIVSGNCFMPRYLGELFPDWEKMDNPPPLRTKVAREEFHFLLSEKRKLTMPHFMMPKDLRNEGNYLISLGELCGWLGERAGEHGVDVFSGVAGAELVFGDDGAVAGVTTSDSGRLLDGSEGENFQAGVEIRAAATVLAEGARGSLTETVISRFGLREGAKETPTFGLGVKEVWQMPEQDHESGYLAHSYGWPTDSSTYAGGFLYKMENGLVHLGFVVGLDYQNPFISPYEEFQKWKTHPEIRKHLEGGACLKYGARVLNESGFNGLPKLNFPGGLLVGCSAGLLNVLKIKGAHNAMKSGIQAGQHLASHVLEGESLDEFDRDIKEGPIGQELYESRHFRGGFRAGRAAGLLNAAISTFSRGKLAFSLPHSGKDCDSTQPASAHTPPVYPPKDGVLTFDILENLSRSGTHHAEGQPKHLVIKPAQLSAPQQSLKDFAGIEERFCPAKVYEFVDAPEGKKLQINSQNCIHCKTCSIKSPGEYIDWRVPQGGDGPEYTIL